VNFGRGGGGADGDGDGAFDVILDHDRTEGDDSRNCIYTTSDSGFPSGLPGLAMQRATSNEELTERLKLRRF
jgi:hypothetical protein